MFISRASVNSNIYTSYVTRLQSLFDQTDKTPIRKVFLFFSSLFLYFVFFSLLFFLFFVSLPDVCSTPGQKGVLCWRTTAEEVHDRDRSIYRSCSSLHPVFFFRCACACACVRKGFSLRFLSAPPLPPPVGVRVLTMRSIRCTRLTRSRSCTSFFFFRGEKKARYYLVTEKKMLELGRCCTSVRCTK